MKLDKLLCLTVFLLGIYTSISYAAECYEYQVLYSNGLSQSAINYLASVTVEACESANDASDLAAQLRKLSSAVYGCPSCVSVAVSGTESGSVNAQKLISNWYLVVQTGDYIATQFVGKDCVSYGFDTSDLFFFETTPDLQIKHEFNPKTTKEEEKPIDLASCSCSSFTWYGNSGLSASDKSEIESAAKTACTSTSSISAYVTSLYNSFYQHFAYADVIASTSTTGGFSVSSLWYGAFSVGCYETVALHNPEACDGYKPPKVFPTPTAIVAYSSSPSASLGPTASSTKTPSISHTAAASVTRSITPTISLTPLPTKSPSPSPAVSGCGQPSCSGHGICQNGVCHCSGTFYYGPQCQYEYCPGNCTNQGTCDPSTGECSCTYPYYGCDCSSILYNCTCQHGTCNQLNGECTCDVGWTGTSCNVSVACADNCNNHGRCTVNETCDCFPGWVGEDCNVTDLNCTQGCDNGGYCNNATGTCSCPYPYFGPQCRYLHCGDGGTNLTCSGNGKCNFNTGSCYCNPGFSGCFCTVWTGSGSPPPPKTPPALPPHLECGTGGTNSTCSGNGQCNHENGACYCDPGWQGCYCNQYNPTRK